MMNWQAISAAGAILFFGTLYAQAANSQPEVRPEAPRGSIDHRLPSASSVKAYRRDAEKGSASSQFKLALMYYHGQGVPQDYIEAANWFRKAAEQGYASAQKNLAVLYGKGEGVPQSTFEAYVWSNIATISGDEGAISIRDFAASELLPEDLEAAQKRAVELYEEIQQRQG
jgi:TPR repeat protein